MLLILYDVCMNLLQLFACTAAVAWYAQRPSYSCAPNEAMAGNCLFREGSPKGHCFLATVTSPTY